MVVDYDSKISIMDDMRETQKLFEKKFAILQEISSTIVSTENIDSIANLMLDLAVSYTNAEKGSLMLLNDREELCIFASRGIPPQLVKSYSSRLGQGIAGIVAGNRVPVLVEDIEKDSRFSGLKRERYSTRSFISCPIISKSKLLGVLNINDKADHTPFTDDEFALIKIVSNQAAITLENAFLMNQLRAKAAELEEINKKLIETDVTKTEFLTRVSHEFRTPLSSIKGAVYYLETSENLGRSEQKEFHEIISNESSKLVLIVENLLDFLRLENESSFAKKTIINISEIVNEVANTKSIRTALTRKNLHFRVDVKGAVSDIVGDRIKVLQLFINLIEGIVHYLENGDSIAITLDETDSVNVAMSVSRRLPEQELQHMFDSRRIMDIERPDERLKLYLAMKVAEAHRWALSAANAGNECVVALGIPKGAKQKVDTAIDTSMEMFTEFAAELLDVNICSIMLSDDIAGDLVIKSAIGLSDDVIKRTRIRPGDRVAGWVAMEGKPLLVEDIEKDERFGKKSVSCYNTHSLLSVPLKIDGKVIGVLNLNNKKSAEAFTARDLDIASVLGERISHYIEKLRSEGYREGDFKKFLTAFDGLLHAQKRYQKKGGRMQHLMTSVMEKVGGSPEQKRNALYVSMVYDLGLMVIGEGVLKKKKLLPGDVRTVKTHPKATISLLEKFEFSDEVLLAILHHHERYDGSGYPDKLKGGEIPLISRVLSVLDAFCAMTTERPYAEKMTDERALDEIRRGSGTLYDPEVARALESALSQS